MATDGNMGRQEVKEINIMTKLLLSNEYLTKKLINEMEDQIATKLTEENGDRTGHVLDICTMLMFTLSINWQNSIKG